MYLCYIDESGTADIPGNTSHYILAGLAIPVWHWKKCDLDIKTIKARYQIRDTEIHVAWILRKYLEQDRIPDFDGMTRDQRIYEVSKRRKAEIIRLQRSGNPKLYKQTRKNYKKTAGYIHLTLTERQNLVHEIALCVSNWRFSRLFAECVDKIHFDPNRAPMSIDEQAFEQVVTRFEQYLEITRSDDSNRNYGILIHDNNETVAKRHTKLMQRFISRGTFWTDISNIIETPLFVDSQLTGMVQVADLCGYALRRYLENNETWLFGPIFERADRKDNVVVGVRHFTDWSCNCEICQSHRT